MSFKYGDTTALQRFVDNVKPFIDGKVNKTGDTMSGTLSSSVKSSSYLAGNEGKVIINSTATAGYTMLARLKSTNGVFTDGAYNTKRVFQYTKDGVIAQGTNAVDYSATILDESGNSSFPGTVTAPTFSGKLNGNANTATTAAKLGRNGNTGVPMVFNWSGQSGQPTYLWGGNDGTNMYVYNPSNFNVKYSAKNLCKRVSQDANTLPENGTFIVEEYNSASANMPTRDWYFIESMNGGDSKFQGQLALGMTCDNVYHRRRTSGAWQSWNQIWTDYGTVPNNSHKRNIITYDSPSNMMHSGQTQHYVNSALLIQAQSVTTGVAAIGFHNPGRRAGTLFLSDNDGSLHFIDSGGVRYKINMTKE